MAPLRRHILNMNAQAKNPDYLLRQGLCPRSAVGDFIGANCGSRLGGAFPNNHIAETVTEKLKCSNTFFEPPMRRAGNHV